MNYPLTMPAPVPKPRSGDILWPTASQPWVNAPCKCITSQPRRGDIRWNGCPDVAPTGLQLLLVLPAFPRRASRGSTRHGKCITSPVGVTSDETVAPMSPRWGSNCYLSYLRSHGWLAVGHRISPLRGFQCCLRLAFGFPFRFHRIALHLR